MNASPEITDAARLLLRQGLHALGVPPTMEPVCEDYLRLLKRWNRAYNLVANTDDETLVTRHVLDSLSARAFLPAGKILDVGTGAGLPGLLLAATMPEQEWVLLDSNGKKVRFCQQAIRHLALPNVQAVQQRIEEHQPQKPYDAVISRAYSRAADFVEQTRHVLAGDGIVIAMKGRIDEEERDQVQALGYQVRIEPVTVPGLTGQRHILIMTRR